MPIQHPRLRGAGKMSYIHITEENIDKEHICCAMSLSLIHIYGPETQAARY